MYFVYLSPGLEHRRALGGLRIALRAPLQRGDPRKGSISTARVPRVIARPGLWPEGAGVAWTSQRPLRLR
eukprot:10163564-Alexandrium_andersonii.AAC.1